jgi:N-acetyl-alpha-D-glucosaminyl L-malate synthase BshA
MKVGMVCYASVGGSGAVATELAHALAARGHDVTLISSEPPFRWRPDAEGLSFERVTIPDYPLFREPQYLLALANSIVRIAVERELEIVHAHYAVPHATAAYLADQMLRAMPGATPLRTITTLHGTDITLIGSDPSYACVVAFSIEHSHAVTAVSASLRADTHAALGIRRAIRVIPNFLDTDVYRRRVDPEFRASLAHSADEPIVLHVSNFRPVKRVDAALEVFRRIRESVPARFVLLGDGPERDLIERRAVETGLGDAVWFAGEQPDPVRFLSAADLFLLPSAQESFGLAALEAMACEVPVIASRVGGLPEIIDDGVTGHLCPPDDLAGMAARGVSLLTNDERRLAMGQAAATVVRERYRTDLVVPLYEEAYLALLGQPRPV